VRQDLVAKAREHWTKWLPAKVAALRQEGRLEESLQGAANLAQAEIKSLQEAGYQAHEAEEVALPHHILLQPEPGAGQPAWEKAELAKLEREYRENLPTEADEEV
jgi:hypothetical protein